VDVRGFEGSAQAMLFPERGVIYRRDINKRFLLSVNPGLIE
jgi:hypothetical protein